MTLARGRRSSPTLLPSVRIVAWLMVAPPFSSKAVPTLAKTLLALGLAFAVVPGMATSEVPQDAVTLAAIALQEALIGASMGFVTYLVFAAVQAAGDLIDVFGGFTLAAAFDPLSQNMNSVLRQALPDAVDDAAVRQQRPPDGDRRPAAARSTRCRWAPPGSRRA